MENTGKPSYAKRARQPTIPATPIPGKLPRFVPLPPNNTIEFYSGLRRGTLNFLVLPCQANDFNPPVESVLVQRPGLQPTRGQRVIVLASLLEYLEARRVEQKVVLLTEEELQALEPTATK